MAYFLISVSNKTNLDLCIKYGLAGFTNSINGLWTFMEIQEGDFVSFLYGAKVYNLYRVSKKKALKDAQYLPPWPLITFSSGKTYYFPFRLHLEPIRQFVESMVKPEFAYVAENLLLRGGYRKTHFQADQTTLQSVSQMGQIYSGQLENLDLDKYETFTPVIVWDRKLQNTPEVFFFQEIILQSLIRQHLSQYENLQALFSSVGLLDLHAEDYEVLGEKALSEGHVDILIKSRMPVGYSKKIIIEVKTGEARKEDIDQLKGYMDEIGEECMGGILVARKFSKKVRHQCECKGVKAVVYDFEQVNKCCKYTIEEVKQKLRLHVL
ncbi:hypothetical protein JOD02_001422 [Caldicoprobacter guelmensis]|uniref:hypothetical protein n=1 Tax=Caldicoprobacter guelmensis TaxID=1170224 RepID=UPI001957E742|nr:hypothetical protein [Caldicoprobacter guelmensis]MBM7582565.1 hypothetical protein [Caldicoprobacter guelmensis]